MKDSGVKWIGQIPINTKIVKLKSISNIINGYAFKSEMFTDDENELNVITISSFDNQKILPEKLSYSIEKKDFSKYLLQENDILIAMSGGTVGKNVLVKNIRKNMYINQRVCILRSQYYKYISYWINSDSFKEYTLLNSIGSAQPNISSTQLNEFDIPWSNEVEKVVDILDEKISIIEDIIVKTKNSIEELKKYKQSLITEVVTKGLDKNVEMKDSGIEWIGDIPKDWEVKKIRYLIKETAIKNNKNQRVLSLYRDYGVVYKDSRSDNHNVTSENTSSYKKVENGNLVINKMKAWQGSMAISNIEGIISPAYFIFEIIDKSIYLPFLNFALRNNLYLDEYKRLSAGLRIGQWDLNKDQFKNINYVFPPTIEEQMKCVKYLEHKIESIDNLIENKSKIIIEYKSYKNSLIYEYVTGKKEVRMEE